MFDRRREIIALDETEISRFLHEDVVSSVYLEGGFVNSNYLVETRDEVFVARFSTDLRPLQIEAALLTRLHDNRHVPDLRTSGSSSSEVGWITMEYIDGELLSHVEQPDERIGAMVSEALVSIHDVRFGSSGFFDETLAIATPFNQVGHAYREYIESLIETPVVRERLGDLCDAIRRWVSSNAHLYDALDDSALIHSDFNLKNLLLCRDRVVVIDWEFAHSGHAIEDLANLFRTEINPDFERGFIEHFAGHKTLPQNWRAIGRALDLASLLGFFDTAAERPKTFGFARPLIENTIAS